jgi:hypothetical protein
MKSMLPKIPCTRTSRTPRPQKARDRRLDSHHKNGLFRGPRFCPFRERVYARPGGSSVSKPVLSLLRTISAGLPRAAEYPGKLRRDFPGNPLTVAGERWDVRQPLGSSNRIFDLIFTLNSSKERDREKSNSTR